MNSLTKVKQFKNRVEWKNEEGVFNSKTPRQSMAGAVSLDGKEAGYFFEKTLDTGLIEGLTLWNVKP